jgi:tetratricopeptide (TPR) repeat protein
MILLVPFIVAGLALGGVELDSTITRVEQAVVLGDLNALEIERDVLEEQGLDNETGGKGLTLYTLAYIDWRRGALHPEDKKKREKALKSSEKLLKELLKLEPNNVEALALHASVNGSLITGTWSAIRRGPRIGKSLDKAMKLEPDNPRLALTQGVNAFFAPKSFGGGLEKAEQALKRAEALFSEEPPDKPWPNWGRVDVYAWLGQVSDKKGRKEEARLYYEKALELEPDHVWIGSVLIPALDETNPSL